MHREHPVSDLLDNGGFTLERASCWNIKAESLLKFLESHFFLASADEVEGRLDILWSQGEVGNWVDHVDEGIQIQSLGTGSSEDIVKSLACAIE